MKKLAPFILFLIVSALSGCCVHGSLRHPATSGFINELKSDTVALVHRDSDGDVAPFCAGVWVAPDKILTADHCAKALVEITLGISDVGDYNRAEVELLESGLTIQYMIDKDSTGVYREPKVLYEATVAKFDFDHDLALLVVKKTVPDHHVARLASSLPELGDNFHVMGHPSALVWTYSECRVGSYREENFMPARKKGPFIQVVGSVWKGNSGGGGFNDRGELVGIASFITPAPNQSFFIHLVTIQNFLK